MGYTRRIPYRPYCCNAAQKDPVLLLNMKAPRRYRALLYWLLVAFWLSPGMVGAQLLDMPPLIDAAERGNIADVQKAILDGASPNIRGGYRSTALIVAAGHGGYRRTVVEERCQGRSGRG